LLNRVLQTQIFCKFLLTAIHPIDKEAAKDFNILFFSFFLVQLFSPNGKGRTKEILKANTKENTVSTNLSFTHFFSV